MQTYGNSPAVRFLLIRPKGEDWCKTEQNVIDQLSQLRQKQYRILVLSTYCVGTGITVPRLNKDDQLQKLHWRLRGLRNSCPEIVLKLF